MGDLGDIVPPITSSPIDYMRGRGKLNATASAVASPTLHGTKPPEETTCEKNVVPFGTKELHIRKLKRCSSSVSTKRRCKDTGSIALLILSEKTPLVGCKTWATRPL